jgi:hypothetical protein
MSIAQVGFGKLGERRVHQLMRVDAASGWQAAVFMADKTDA